MEPVKIHPPEGFEVCPTSTQTEIRFRPISKSKPKWEDIRNIEGYFINGACEMHSYEGLAGKVDKNVWPTKEEAEAALALSQLCQWRDKYNEGWRPDYTKCGLKWTIQLYENQIKTFATSSYPCILIFKTEEIRDKFLEDFAELIEIAKPLL
jgi:hypothetical protein